MDQKIYKDLPKEEKKALFKEFKAQDPSIKVMLICSIVCAVSVIIIAISGFVGDSLDNLWFTLMPASFFGIIVPSSIELNYTKWLLEKKNIKKK